MQVGHRGRNILLRAVDHRGGVRAEHQGVQAHEGGPEAQRLDGPIQRDDRHRQAGQLLDGVTCALGDAQAHVGHRRLRILTVEHADELAGAARPVDDRGGLPHPGAQTVQQRAAAAHLPHERVAVALDVMGAVEDRGRRPLHPLLTSRNTHAPADQEHGLRGQRRRAEGRQRGEPEGVELGEQRLGALLGHLAARGALLGRLALTRPHAAVDLADRGERALVERLGAHRDVPVLNGRHRREDPVVAPVPGPVEHIGAHGPPGLEIVPHELEDAGRHVVMPDDVVRRADHLLARVARERHEGLIRIADDAFKIGRREEDVLGAEEALIALDGFHAVSRYGRSEIYASVSLPHAAAPAHIVNGYKGVTQPRNGL